MLEKRRIVSALIFNAIGETVNKIGPFLIYSVAMQRLGAQMFGQAQLAISVLEVAIPWVMLASHQVGVMETGRALGEGARRPNVMLPLTLGRCFLGLLATCVLFLLAYFHKPWQSFRELLLPLCLILLPLTNEGACVMLGMQKVKTFSVIQTSGRILSLLAIFLLVQNERDADLYALLTLGANALISFATVVWSWNIDGWRWSGWVYFSHLWKKSLLLGLPFFLLIVHDRVDLFFANQMLGDHGAGVYAAPMRLTQGLSNLIGPVSMVFYSEMVRALSKESLERHARLEFFCLFTIFLPLALGGMILSRSILDLVFGAEAISAASTLAILIWIPLLQCAYTVYGQHILSIEGQHWSLVIGVSLGLFVTLVCYYGLRNQGTLSIIAWSSLAGKSAMVVWILWRAHRFVGLFRWADIRSALFSGFIMAMTLLFLDGVPSIVSISVGAIVYLSTFLLWERSRFRELVNVAMNRRNSLPR